jgi:hypothetical protein
MNTWRGVPGTKFVWRGPSADPGIEYDGEILNGNEVEDFAWSVYKSECAWNKTTPSESDFDEKLAPAWFGRRLAEFMFGKFGN